MGQKQEFDFKASNNAFEPTEEEKENVKMFQNIDVQGMTKEEKEYTEKITQGLHIFDVAIWWFDDIQNVMTILKKLILDEPCKWHIDRKVYEQGWEYHFDSFVC